MTTTTKITLALLVLIGYAFFTTVDVFADAPEYVRTFSSLGRATYTEKVQNIQHNETISAPYYNFQDLNNCTFSTTGGIMVCVDICGGLTVPGAWCSYE